MNRPKRTTIALAALAAGSALAFNVIAPSANELAAVSLEDSVVEVEVNRDAAELREVVRPEAFDHDVINTALVFNNAGHGHALVRCAAFGAGGQVVGRVRLRVPGRGLRFALASDMTNGLDFIGSAQCKSDGRILATGILVGPAANLTDVDVEQHHWEGSRIRYPFVASF